MAPQCHLGINSEKKRQTLELRSTDQNNILNAQVTKAAK
jgi:hypothetical protein